MEPHGRPLSAVTKHLVMPTGIVSTEWPKIRLSAHRKLGVRFDGWQDGCGQIMLSKRADGRLACTVGGFAASFARQSGKTYYMTAALFTLSIEKPGLLSLWTAHHSRTHAETFLYMQAFCRQPRVEQFIADVFTGSGDEEVRFVNGSRILFGARERGFGRGIPNVDVEVFDEAQILSMKALENMLAAMNRSPFGLHVYLGTPPKQGDPCEAFEEMRAEALALEEGQEFDSAWVECGADDDADLDDREQWAKANPSYPEHTSAESILRLRKRLGPDGFRREGLGIWPGNIRTVFDLVGWLDLVADVAPGGRVALVAHVGEYRKTAAIAVAGVAADGGVVVLVDCGDGMEWVTQKVIALVAKHDVVEVALCPGEARGLEGELASAGVEFKKLAGTDIAASCTAFQAAVTESAAAVARKERPTLRYTYHHELDGAVAKAKTRRVGPSETWEEGTGSALIGAAAAYHRWRVLADIPYDVLASIL
jgi:hypothetical protein